MEERFSKERRRCFDFSSAREDMISNLPDSLISQLLSYLSTKEAVRTSVLSNRWKSLWLLMSELDLDSCEFQEYNAFASFVDKFLDFSRIEKPCLHKVKLSVRKDKNDPPCVNRWIDILATPKLKHLDFECGPVKRECLEVMPLSLYTCCQKLLHLRLHRVLFGKLESSVSLPCLKTMRLEHNAYASDACLETLISSCPVLEDLRFVRRLDGNVKVLRVHSQTLTSLSIELGAHDFEVEDWVDISDDLSLRVLIDAPRLKYLNLNDAISECKTISNLGSLTKVNLLGSFFTINSHDGDSPYHFFISILGVRDMKISRETFGLIQDIMPLPQFCNISCLEAELQLCHLDKLPTFLEICPNLRSLILDLFPSSWGEETRLSFVPRCLLSTLEFVEIKTKFSWNSIPMELAIYFAKNSVILKKLSVRSSYPLLEKHAIVLRGHLRCSTCQIIVS